MAKKQLARERNRNLKSPDKTRSSPKINVKNNNSNRSRISETANGHASSEDMEVAVVPSSSVESANDEISGSSASEDDGVERRSSGDEEDEEVEEENEEKKKNVRGRGKKDDAKNLGKKRSRKEEDDSEAEDKCETALYTFPMARVSRIIKSETPDVKISQEAVFVINKASEKFLQLFSKEAYACAFLDKKKHIAYSHLSSVVAKRKRFEFLADFVPEKVKAEDASAQVAEAEKGPRLCLTYYTQSSCS